MKSVIDNGACFANDPVQHVGIRRYQSFLRQVYNLLDDDGVFVFQVAGIRPHWQYEDLIWLVPCFLFVFAYTLMTSAPGVCS